VITYSERVRQENRIQEEEIICWRENEEKDICFEVHMGNENDLTLRRLMSYIYGAPILDVSRSHTTTQHSR